MESDSKTLKVALVGNPNCGKTTLFNQLTGSNQSVGNWPGVTVEKKSGVANFEGVKLEIIDLPGIYSLSPYSQEEGISRDCIMKDSPDIIINVVDATNVERNLYLTTQLAELGITVIVALNMIDVLHKRGDKINSKVLEKETTLPVVNISASKGVGINDLLALTVRLSRSGYVHEYENIYSPDVDDVISDIEEVLARNPSLSKAERTRFVAVKVFESDPIINKLHLTEDQRYQINIIKKKVKTTQNIDYDMIIADQRYKYICHICVHALIKKRDPDSLTVSDKIDRFVTNRVWAIPIFVGIMLMIFYITFGPFGIFLQEKVSDLIALGSEHIESLLVQYKASEWAISLVKDGIIGGLGAIASFLPQMLILFTLLSVLEDSGYMARAAFIMDHFLRKVGLSGKAFVPMLMGFGCTVPAILATRALDTDRDKRLTILITPFMSCNARMFVYALFVKMFFPRHQTLVILSIYVLGIVVAIFTAFLFKGKIMKGHFSPFVMELPSYRFPTLRTLWLHVGERLRDFVVKAGTVLLAANIIVWFLNSFDLSLKFSTDIQSNSMLSMVGKVIAPIFTWCGFGDWRASVALLTGIIAKESVVLTMNSLYAGLSLDHVFTPLSAYSFMIFVLLYTPCVAALSVIAREMRSFKWTVTTVVYQMVIAWFVSALIYQFGTLLFRADYLILLFASVIVGSGVMYLIKSTRKKSCPPCAGKCSECNKIER